MDFVVYQFYKLFTAFLRVLPLELVFVLGQILGFIGWAFGWSYRRLALANLRIAYAGEKSEAELRRIVLGHFTRLGANMLSSLKIASMPVEEILKRVEFENLHLPRDQAKDRGVVFVLSHMGNWELLAQLTRAISNKPIGTVYQRLGNRYIDADIRRIRMRMGMDTFERKAGFQRALELLRQKGGVGVLVDQHAGDAGVWSPFFGRLASTSPLAATLALRTGAMLLPAAVYTIGLAKWRVAFSELLPPPDLEANELTALINGAVEEQVRLSPEDWFWVHKRWKTPEPKLLFVGYKRGIAYPPNFERSRLKPFPILIRASNWLGDAVMSAPAVRAIKNGRPDAHIAVLTHAKLADFWRAIPEIDEVICFEEKSILEVVRKIRGRFEVAVVFPNSVRTALEVYLAGIPRRIGYAAKWRRLLLNQQVPSRKPGPIRHQVHHYLDLAAHMGAELGEARQTRASRPFPAGSKITIGLCPGAEYGPAKRWDAGRFAEVAKQVASELSCQWLLFGVAKDAPIGDQIAAQLGSACTNLIGKTSLAQLINHLRECQLLLTNDTGTMHLAAFLGIPTVAIFGSTEPALTGPWGGGHRVIRNHVDCSPCFLRNCPLDFRCMTSVQVEEVKAAVLQLLRRADAQKLTC